MNAYSEWVAQSAATARSNAQNAVQFHRDVMGDEGASTRTWMSEVGATNRANAALAGGIARDVLGYNQDRTMANLGFDREDLAGDATMMQLGLRWDPERQRYV